MRELEQEYFYENLKPEIIKKFNDLISKQKTVNLCEKIELGTYITAIIISVKNYKAITGTITGNTIAELCVALLIITAVNINTKPIKDKYKKMKEEMRNNLIIKVCKCEEYCNCKEDFVKLLKMKNIDIFK